MTTGQLSPLAGVTGTANTVKIKSAEEDYTVLKLIHGGIKLTSNLTWI